MADANEIKTDSNNPKLQWRDWTDWDGTIYRDWFFNGVYTGRTILNR